MPTKLTLLGTGTCHLEKDRAASSVLIELGDLKVVFDIGRGVTQRFAELNLTQDSIRNIVLSHFHPDHLSDLIPFLHAAAHSKIDPRKLDLHIYGPKGVKVQVMRLMSLFAADDLAREEYDIHIHEIRSEKFSINRQEFQFINLPPSGNHGLKFDCDGKTIALTGDSKFHPDEVKFITGVDLAVVDSGHLSDNEILDLAVQSQAKTIVLSHFYRDLDESVLGLAGKSRGYRGKFVVGKDLMSFDL